MSTLTKESSLESSAIFKSINGFQIQKFGNNYPTPCWLNVSIEQDGTVISPETFL